MKFELSANSWHFKLANFGSSEFGRRVSVHGSNICEYIRAMMAGTFWLMVSLTFLGLAALWVGFSIHDLAMCIMNGGLIAPYTLIFLVLVACAVAVPVVVYLHERHKERKEQAFNEAIMKGEWKEPEPSFLTLAYRKFKNKTCFRIEFK